jgi:hypothetical protein
MAAAIAARRLGIKCALPPKIGQIDYTSCWAAALYSWLCASGRPYQGGHNKLIMDLSREVEDRQFGLSLQKAVPIFQNRFQMDFRLVNSPGLIRGLEPRLFFSYLQARQYLYMWYNLPHNLKNAHLVVVYGISHVTPNTSRTGNNSDCLIHVMDPLPEGEGSYKTHSLKWLRGTNFIALGYGLRGFLPRGELDDLEL